VDKPAVDLLTPTLEEMDAVRQIFQEYADSLNIDLEFQGFETELAELPGDYAEPAGIFCWLMWTAALQAAVHCAPWMTPTIPMPPR
jgi:phytoene/squalene synthetase